MITFIFVVRHNSKKRGYNRTVSVYQVGDKIPRHIGTDDQINTAAYKGDYAIACELIAEHTDYALDATGYRLADDTIKVIEVT